MENLDIIVRKPSFAELHVKGDVTTFFKTKLAEALADGSLIKEENWYSFFKNNFSEKWKGFNSIPKGKIISAENVLRSQIVNFDSVSDLFAMVVLLRTGTMSQTDLKYERIKQLVNKVNTLDYDRSDLESIKVKLIYEQLDNLFGEKLRFDFRVGQNSNINVDAITNYTRRLSAEYNKRMMYFNKGFELISTAVNLSRLVMSEQKKIVKFVIDNDLEAIVDKSPLAKYFLNTNVAFTSKLEGLNEVLKGKGVLLKGIKRLKNFTEHQEAVVKLLDHVYTKKPAFRLRNIFNADITELRSDEVRLDEDNLEKRQYISSVLFLDVNIKTNTNQRVEGYTVYDRIEHLGLTMFAKTEDQLPKLVDIHDESMRRQVERFDIVKRRAKQQMASKEDFAKYHKRSPWFSSLTLACIFSDRIIEEGEDVYFEFQSEYALLNENVRKIGEDDSSYVFRTTEPATVVKYAYYEKLITGKEALQFNLSGTLPTLNRELDITQGTYTEGTFEDRLDRKLQYFDEYEKLLQTPNLKLKQIKSWEEVRRISTDSGNFKDYTFRELFEYLEVIVDDNTELYTVLDSTPVEQQGSKWNFFISKLDKKNRHDQLAVTSYVNDVIDPVRRWLDQYTGLKIVPTLALHTNVKLSDEYKLACFYLINEILNFLEIPVREDLIEFIDPVILVSRIGDV